MGLKVLIRWRGEFMHLESSRQFSKDPPDEACLVLHMDNKTSSFTNDAVHTQYMTLMRPIRLR